MGGFGSGRPSGWGSDKVEACRSINVNDLHRAGCLSPNWQGIWQWKRDGETVAAVGIRGDQARFSLDYRVRIRDGDWEHVVEIVNIDRVQCRFGGQRPYFICPGAPSGNGCGRRVVKLHLAERNFLCRHCCQLTYSSQCECPTSRLRRKALKRIAQLGGDSSTGAFVPRPKGMWKSTFERLRRQAFDLQMDADEAFDSRYAKMEEYGKRRGID